MSNVIYDGDVLRIKLTGGGEVWEKDLALIKSLPGCVYLEDRFWEASPLRKSVQLMINGGFRVDQSAFKFAGIAPEGTLDLSLFSEFREYQKEGIIFTDVHGGVSLIGDQTGLGKTIQAIGFFMLHPEIRPIVVVCPASVKYNWRIEIKKWLPKEKVEIIEGEKTHDLVKADWYIINYNILAKVTQWNIRRNPNGKDKKFIGAVAGWIDRLEDAGVKALVGDEIQFISNHHTIMGFSFIQLCRLIRKPLIFLSGTPIRNCPGEFYTALNLLNPKRFSNRSKFYQRFCDPKHNGFAWTYKGASHLDELHVLLEGVMIRREKREVLKDLPPTQYTNVSMALSPVESKSYFAVDKEFAEWVQNTKRGLEDQKQLAKLKQAAYLAKRNSVIEWVQEFLDSGEKLVLIGYYHKVLEDLYTHFHKVAVKIDGSNTALNKQQMLEQFMNKEKCRLLIGQIQTAGVGMDGMQKVCSSLAFVEYSEIPTDVVQAVGRVERWGQKDPINIYNLIGYGTVDEYIIGLLTGKYSVISQVLDGKEGDAIFGGDFNSDLIEIYRKKGKQ